ncbi:MMPL family transporter [Asanoa iriomotensis]|uniref:Membrane protein ActII-3 n=1 Tax=Asanoa iriomotensis TaxID=234613 RepID=A0ABQ4C0W5_9ACTN|nr:MMPL family transporter [Asanoa iriomotensis]GIF56416.1 putative membrane protein ActII-3 [Asanoa iriomotensis]
MVQTETRDEAGTAPRGPNPGRLARFPGGRRTKWLVLGLWVVLLAVAGPVAGKLESIQNDDPISFLPANAESTQVHELENRFESDVTPAVIVYERDGGVTAADEAKAREDIGRLSALGNRAGDIVGPNRSEDGEALQVILPLHYTQEIDKEVNEVRDIVGGGESGLDVYVTGPAGALTDVVEAFGDIDTTLLLTALAVVVVLLLLIYRSPFLWFVPVACTLVALSMAQAGVYLLGKYFDVSVNGMSSGILLVLVFGVGTDYALLLIARYREELRSHQDKHEAMALAVKGAGPAILASAATVIIALLFLLLADLNSNSGLGPVAAAGVACAFVVLMTLLPALMTVLPRGVFWPAVPRYDPTFDGSDATSGHRTWGRIASVVGARPRVVWVVTALVLGAMAFGLTSLKATGLADKDSFVTKPESVSGAEALGRHFAVGSADPTVVIGEAAAAGPLRSTLQATEGVAQVGEPLTADGLVRFDVSLADEPYSQAAFDTVERLRTAVDSVPDAAAKVGGYTAIRLDTVDAAERDRDLLIPIVLLVVLAVLIVLLRAFVAPLLLIATVVLSFAAALGISAFLFDTVFNFAGSDPNFPLLAFVFLVALGVDYNIFLVTRVREEAVHVGTRAGVIRGLVLTGGVITSAGLVLAATFAAATSLPLVSMIQLGFAVALGVLLDTFIVRSLLVPALSLDVGRRIWWPSRLAKQSRH